MTKEPVIILAEDDNGHAGLIINSLKLSGITNTILHFEDGEDILPYPQGADVIDYFFNSGECNVLSATLTASFM